MEAKLTDAELWHMMQHYIADMVLHGDVQAKRALIALCGLRNVPALEPLLTLAPVDESTQELGQRLFEHFAAIFGTIENATTVARYIHTRDTKNDIHAQAILKSMARAFE